MARRCDICGKGTTSGNNVSHSHKKTRRKWKANLVNMRIKQGNSIKKVKVCTRCLRSEKIKKAL